MRCRMYKACKAQLTRERKARSEAWECTAVPCGLTADTAEQYGTGPAWTARLTEREPLYCGWYRETQEDTVPSQGVRLGGPAARRRPYQHAPLLPHQHTPLSG